MTNVFDEKGRQVPVTIIEAGPCQVLQVKTVKTDGYNALQLGFDEQSARRTTKPVAGHLKKAGATPKRFIREVRTDEVADVQPGSTFTVSVFDGVVLVDVTGVSKGKGFQGVVKRHGFAGQEASHGTERKHRSAGGIGRGAGIPGRGIALGKRMAGHMGHERSTAQKIKILKIDPEANLLVLHGSVPGPNGGYVYVQNTRKGGPGESEA
jgi:large subunit ribosomal protein L3